MGVWPSGPRSRARRCKNSDLRRAYAGVLPDWREEDVTGSPYCQYPLYEVSPR